MNGGDSGAPTLVDLFSGLHSALIPVYADQCCCVVSYDVMTCNILQRHARKVALLGLMTAEPIVHRKGAFGGAVETMIPVQEAARKAVEEMKARGDVDAIIPLTHQDMADDVVRPYFSPTFQSPEHPTFFFSFFFFFGGGPQHPICVLSTLEVAIYLMECMLTCVIPMNHNDKGTFQARARLPSHTWRSRPRFVDCKP